MLHDYVKCEEKGYRVIEVDTIYDTETPQKLGIVNINIPAQLRYHDSRDKNFYNYYQEFMIVESCYYYKLLLNYY